ncbi:MAG TPA: hypothetical protein VK961_18875 [Chthoniobacter sp.]|nr:hypothetical protein [Chthoniobacter sp.]
MHARWDLARFDAKVRASQPLRQASQRYMRNHMDLNVLEDAQHYPRVE